VVAVGVGQPDPANICRVDHVGQRREVVLVGRAETGVDDDRLLGVENERVDRQKAEPGHLGVVAEDGDVGGDAVSFHGGSSSGELVE
jgi:hypothetical protein